MTVSKTVTDTKHHVGRQQRCITVTMRGLQAHHPGHQFMIVRDTAQPISVGITGMLVSSANCCNSTAASALITPPPATTLTPDVRPGLTFLQLFRSAYGWQQVCRPAAVRTYQDQTRFPQPVRRTVNPPVPATHQTRTHQVKRLLQHTRHQRFHELRHFADRFSNCFNINGLEIFFMQTGARPGR